MCDFRSGDDVSLTDSLEGIDTMSIPFPLKMLVILEFFKGKRIWHIHDLHNFAETALAHNLQ